MAPKSIPTCTPLPAPPFQLGVLMPDGAHHILKLYNQSDPYSNGTYWYNPVTGLDPCNSQTSLSAPLTYYTTDGSYIRVVISSVNNPNQPLGGPWQIFLPDGTIASGIGWPTTATGTPISNLKSATSIQDRNGNKVAIAYSTDGTTTTLTDDLGRTVTIKTVSPGTINVTQTGAAGQTLTWTLGGASFFEVPATCMNAGNLGCGAYGGGGPAYLNVPADFQVSANSTTITDGNTLQYKFTYDSGTGELTSITTPYGAMTSYQYSSVETSVNSTSFNDTYQVTAKIVSWTDYADGGSSARTETWGYSYGGTQPAGTASSYVTKITRPDNGVETITFNCCNPLFGLVEKDVMPDGSGTEYEYEQNPPFLDSAKNADLANPFPYLTAHIAGASGSPSLAAVDTTTIDQNGNMLTRTSTDWMPYSQLTHDLNSGYLTGVNGGTTLRAVTNSYTVGIAAATNGSGATDSNSGYWNPNAPYLRGLLQRSVTSGAGTGSATEFSYDSPSTGNPVQERHWDSTKAASLPGSLSSSNASVTVRKFDQYGNLTSVTDPNQNQTTYTYDSNSLYVQQEIEAYGSQMARKFSYVWDDNLGLVTSRTDVDNGVTTSYSYDPLGRQIQEIETNAEPRQVNTIYDDQNRRVITERDINIQGGGENRSVANYDQLGRVTLTQFLNTGNLNATDLTNGLKVQTRYMYYKNNLYKLVSNPYPEATTQGSATGCYNRVPCTIGFTLTQYDQNGRPLNVTTYDGSSLPAPFGSGSTANTAVNGVTQYSYSGNTTTVTDAAGKKRVTTVDAGGRLSGVTEDPGGLGYATTYSYDALDDLTSVSQNGAAQTRTFTYDSLKRLGKAMNPESGTVSYTYDANGNLLSKTDNRGYVTNYSYDALNRLTAKSYSAGTGTPNVSYNYCNSPNCCNQSNCVSTYAIGRLISVTAAAFTSIDKKTNYPAVTTNYLGYDTFGRVYSHSQVIGSATPLAFSYNWALADNLLGETYPSGRQITLGYGNVSYPQYVGGTYGSTSTTYLAWLNFGNYGEVARSYGPNSNLIWNRTYNNRGQDTALALNDWATSNNGLNYTQFIQQYNYSGSIGNNGNLVSSAESFSPGAAVPYASLPAFLNQTYSYDGVNRLVSVSDPSYSRTFCYDAYGNGWVNSYTGQFSGDTPNENGLSCSAATPYKANNQISSVVTAGGYDAAGNQTIVKGNTLTYDAENRLISVMSGATAVATYQYDGDGHRIAKTASGVTTNYIYDAFGRLAAEYVNGVLSKDYIRMMSGYIPGGSDLVAIENGPGNAGSPCGTCFVMVDDLGSVRVMTDTGGDIISRHDYLPFGEEVLAGGGRPGGYGFGVVDGASERFTGKERDSESGLDNSLARYFGSSLGRFASPDPEQAGADPANPQSWDAYPYVVNNPLNLVDPTGLDVNCVGGQNVVSAVTTDSNGVIKDTVAPCGGGFPTTMNVLPFNTSTITSSRTGATYQVPNPLLGTAFPVAAAARGRAFEKMVLQLLKTNPNRVKLVTKLGRAVPDAYRAGKVVVEIKDVQYLYKTGQISAELAGAAEDGSTLYVLVSPTTSVAGTVAAEGATVGVVDLAAGTITDAVTGSSLLETLIGLLAIF